MRMDKVGTLSMKMVLIDAQTTLGVAHSLASWILVFKPTDRVRIPFCEDDTRFYQRPPPNPPKCPPSSSRTASVSSLLPQRRPPSTTRPRTTARLRRYATLATAPRRHTQPRENEQKEHGHDQETYDCAHTKYTATIALFSRIPPVLVHTQGTTVR